MIDPFGRQITYLRLSVTDRCDLRCIYCMAERMTFLPKAELLTLDELDRLATAFISRGVRKLRITGGEPLVRRGVVDLIEELGRHVRSGHLDELTLTTNATQLAHHADRLAAAGVKRINVSLDSVDPETFERVTRGGKLETVLQGLEAAQKAGLSTKINTVVLATDNQEQIGDLVAWAHGCGHDLTLIEVMPMGDTGIDRLSQYVPLTVVRAALEKRFTLIPTSHTTGGPSRYLRVAETGRLLGLITPLTNNFCAGCNRVRVSATGQLALCLGREEGADLRAPLRMYPDDDRPLHMVLDEALGRKPEGHGFDYTRFGSAPAVSRHMSVTGG